MDLPTNPRLRRTKDISRLAAVFGRDKGHVMASRPLSAGYITHYTTTTRHTYHSLAYNCAMTSRLDLSMDTLREVAKQTLGTSHDAIPAGYLEELRRHVEFSKDDTLFRVYPQPGYGYGTVRCLEQGCEDATIQLGQKTGSKDNGLNEGVGSLAAYRVHVQEHPTHEANRYARVKAEIRKQSNGAVTSLSLQAQDSSTLDGATIPQNQASGSLSISMDGLVRGGTSHSTSNTPQKLEPSDSSSSIIPTKRSFAGDDMDIGVPSPSHSSPSMSKRPKVEQIRANAIHPLGTIDRNSSVPVSVSAPRAGPFMPREARFILDETIAANDTVRTPLTHFYKKTRKLTYDRQWILEFRKQLQEHLGLTPPLFSGSNAQLPAVSPSESDSLGGLPRTTPPVNTGVLPVVPVGLPNYGDTVDYESDDDIRGDRFGNRLLLNRGPIAHPGDIDKFLIEAGNSELFDGNESVDKALTKLGLNKLGEHLPLMTIALMPHQVIGVAWMLEHERGSHKGGILADEMGLGKTVQMISTMVHHQSDDPAVKSTLICAPLALLDQWKLEIETKTDGGLSCLIYHGPNKPKLKKNLQKFDVVLTTFQTLALEWPDDRKKKKRKKDQGDSDDFMDSDSEKEKKPKKEGLLLRMKWFRVVLDEAQNIRNRNTRVSNAVTYVDATYRWCLTGTPIINSLSDGYALMRFLQIRPWYDWQDFNNHIAQLEKKRPDLASSRLQAILNACLIRRKKDSVLDGKKLIELPPKDVVLRRLTFTQDERDIYDVIEKRSQAIINKYLRAGTILKNYSSVLVLLLRLRQLCSHPCLIQEGGDAFLLPDEDPTLKYKVQTEIDRATTLAGEQFVTALKAKLKATALERMAAEKASAEAAIEDECPVCFDTFTDPIVTRCGHVFCAECIDSVLKQLPVEDGNERRHAIAERPCPTCREPIQKEMLFELKAFEPLDAVLDETQPAVVTDEDDDDGVPIAPDCLPNPKKGRSKVKTRFTKRIQQSDEDYDHSDNSLSDFIVERDEDEEEKDARRELKQKLTRNKRVVLDSDEDIQVDDEVELLPPTAVRKKKGKTVQRFLPSTKMKEMMSLLKEWADKEDTKNEKVCQVSVQSRYSFSPTFQTIVISQWTSCLDLIADYLDENGFTFVRYQGDMSRLARDEAVRIFMSQGKARVMLMSLKCGGVGLNLTRANRVISIDLGWSSAIENQAFDRVHRLGQVRPVVVQRLVIEDTVETRILALQERKQNLADGSLGEGTGKKLGRLSVKDLANLFGLDARGREL
ncbi:SNF2 family N-terminal domain-containing protein [Gautieria morchelliformis]|nr:SNF2 family N-terminal domain-containing protein [Gautieria morchelliformis]